MFDKKKIFHPSLFYMFLDPGSGIRDPGSEIRDPGSGMGKNQDPGSGINIPDPQHWLSVTKWLKTPNLKEDEEPRKAVLDHNDRLTVSERAYRDYGDSTFKYPCRYGK